MISDSAKAAVAEFQRLIKIKQRFWLSDFHLYYIHHNYSSASKYVLSERDRLSYSDTSLQKITDPDEFESFCRLFSPPHTSAWHFIQFKDPTKKLTDIQAFAENYLISKLAGI